MLERYYNIFAGCGSLRWCVSLSEFVRVKSEVDIFRCAPRERTPERLAWLGISVRSPNAEGASNREATRRRRSKFVPWPVTVDAFAANGPTLIYQFHTLLHNTRRFVGSRKPPPTSHVSASSDSSAKIRPGMQPTTFLYRPRDSHFADSRPHDTFAHDLVGPQSSSSSPSSSYSSAYGVWVRSRRRCIKACNALSIEFTAGGDEDQTDMSSWSRTREFAIMLEIIYW